MRWRVILGPDCCRIWPQSVKFLVALACAGWAGHAGGQGLAPGKYPGPRPAVDRAVRRAGADEPAAPEIEVDSTEIRTEVPAVPGAAMVLTIGQGAEDGTRYRWVQVEGPAVAIEVPAKPSIKILIPGGAERLAFLAVAARRDLVRVVRVVVPIQGDAARASWGARPSGKVKADAGDDQVGLVGRRVTLNGSRSVPADGKTARWLQVGGPPVLAPQQEGSFFSFVPAGPGLHRFLLMVAGEGEVSEPDEVAVLVGTPPPGAAPPPAPVQAPVAAPAPTPDQILAGALPGLPNAPRVANDVADIMEAISDRAALYSSFSVLQAELARRLDLIVPADPAERAAWNQGVFTPLTAFTTTQLLAAGMDVRQAQGLQQPLTAGQREKVSEHFQRLARAFRAAGASR